MFYVIVITLNLKHAIDKFSGKLLSPALIQQIVIPGTSLLHEIHFLFEVLPTEELSCAQDELLPLL